MRNPGNQERKNLALEHEALTERIIAASGRAFSNWFRKKL